MSRTQRLTRLVLDFDGTLTRKDTLHLVAQAGYRRQQRERSAVPIQPWDDIVDAYIADFARHKQTYEPEKHLRRTVETEAMWLNSLKSVEDASAQRAYKAGIFDHITAEDMHVAAMDALERKQVQLRSGWASLLNQVYISNQQVIATCADVGALQIISVNWSRQFIWSVLKIATEDSQALSTHILADIAIYANEIPSIAERTKQQADHASQYPGATRDLRVSGDKLEAMLISMTNHTLQQTSWLTIYIGDSSTDLQCLLSSDIGICIRDDVLNHSQNELLETLDRLQIPSKHISDCTIGETSSKSLQEQISPFVWWCKDLQEVADWLKASAYQRR